MRRRPPNPRRLATALALAAALLLGARAAAGEGCPPGMQAVGGGAFRLGDGGAESEVAPFCLDRTEVTVAAYSECALAGSCAADKLACGKAATFGKKGHAQHPLNCVSWVEADGYCRHLGKRLPTEAEWEWAARGGPRGATYPWGEGPPAARACWDGDGNAEGRGNRVEPCPVAAHPGGVSPDGVHDLAGNVREWTATPFERFRVLRGGSWGDSLASFLSAAFRGANAPDERFELTGFRCAADPGAAGRLAAARPGPRAGPDAVGADAPRQPGAPSARPAAPAPPAATPSAIVPLLIELPAR